MRHFQKLILLIALLILSPAQSALAQTYTDSYNRAPLVKVRILPEKGQIKAGEDLWLTIEQTIEPEWHTYWKNAGDSGAPPRIQWDLPDGLSVGDISFPAPDKIPYGPLLNYGYSDKVILLQKLTAQDNLPAGDLTLKADFEVLVCKDECLPEFSKHTIRLNVAGAPNENNSGYISAAQAAFPTPSNQMAYYSEDQGNLIIRIAVNGEDIERAAPDSIEYFPEGWGLIDYPAPSSAKIADGTLTITQARAQGDIADVENTKGLISYISDTGMRKSISFESQYVGAAQNSLPESPFPLLPLAKISLAQALIFALIGGIILNLMPCVFPVLSIKALSLVKISEKHPEMAKAHGLSYSAGVILSFLGIAAILMGVKAAGYSVGWGFQLQNPIVVSLLAYILFLVGLNLAGYFNIGSHFGQVGQKLTQGSGLKNSFATGILATLVATPCTAPFMAAAIGFALVQPAWVGLSIFGALGLGLALPYLILCFMPSLQKRLPKPGQWMEHLRHFLAFPMLASSVWLVWVLGKQAGSSSVSGVLLGMLALSFGIWLIKIMPRKGFSKLILKALVLLSFLAPLALLPVDKNETTEVINIKEEMSEVYSPNMLGELLEEDAPIFVEMTAAWCITCKVTHALAINVPSTQKVFKKYGVRYLIGDWTNYDPDITAFLNSYGRDGVPVYIYYGPRSTKTGQRPDAKLLPQILTPSLIKSTVEQSFNEEKGS